MEHLPDDFHRRGDDQPVETIVRDIAERIVREVSRPIEVGGIEIGVSASVGIALAPDGTDVETSIASADVAMYAAKRSGGAGHRVAVSAAGRMSAVDVEA